MDLIDVKSFAAGRWVDPGEGARLIEDALTGQPIARAGNAALDVAAMLAHAKTIGGPRLREKTFHDRARMLKAVALKLGEHKDELYELSYPTGGTLKDHKIDIDGGITTLAVFASKGRRELPDTKVYVDGNVEQLSRNGTFMGQHIATPLQGVAVHINAFNFPVWGMLEKLGPTLLAGVPAIVKPATATAHVAERAAKIILDSGLLPEGALQLITGGLGDLLDRLTGQDVVSFTGSAQTALTLRANPVMLAGATRFIAEQDSLNASVLGPDATPGTPEFDLFIKEVQREMTAKAGQKCTAIRRILVPDSQMDAVTEAIIARLQKTVVGDPRAPETTMGALVSIAQKDDVLAKSEAIAGDATRIFGDPATTEGPGAFLPPLLYRCTDPDSAAAVHDVEAFGPVATVMPYKDLDHAATLLNRGKGSLVASLITHDGMVARALALASAAFHGRLYINDRTSMGEATGHGSPLPHLIHGGPGRAGGGEEMGGVRGVMHYMQRTAVQGSPDMLTAVTGRYTPGAAQAPGPTHPFRRTFDALTIGETLKTPPRTVTLDDIETFANFTGDTFYAHMDEAAAARNPFFPGRVAHGYLLLSFAAGLFVEPAEGPVLANTGLDNLRFQKPVSPGEAIHVTLTVKQKTLRNEDYGEVRWHVVIANADDEPVATYDLLTMNATGR
ncbi:MAG: phenylacetic acid degradation bifunctional protein PaaZ [Pseudomonadota bacterium]